MDMLKNLFNSYKNVARYSDTCIVYEIMSSLFCILIVLWILPEIKSPNINTLSVVTLCV